MTVASGRLRAGAFGVVAASRFAMMAASNVATPLYAIPTRSLLVLLLAGLLCGAGHGLGFLGGQAQLSLAAPPDHRGAVNAAFYTLIYLGVAVAVVSTGLLTLHFALSTAVAAFVAVVGGPAVVGALWHVRSLRGESQLLR
jgi:hypothetical protein